MRLLPDLITRYVLAIIVAAASAWFFVVIGPLTLWLSSVFIKMFYPVTLLSDGFVFKNIVLQFIPACAAIPAYILLGLLVLTTRNLLWGDRWLLWLMGSFLILLINVFRILLLTIILFTGGKNWFDAVHIFFWHVVASFMVVVIWWWLIKKFKIKSIPLVDDVRFLRKLF
ncbi:MAG: pacearchaeosortase [Nanoarchaeota archaeon]|nr:pacearchaeosortase [Nanoarchaeota archaeon]